MSEEEKTPRKELSPEMVDRIRHAQQTRWVRQNTDPQEQARVEKARLCVDRLDNLEQALTGLFPDGIAPKKCEEALAALRAYLSGFGDQ